MVLEDKLLIWKLKSGSKEALQRIYEKYKNDLLKVAVSLSTDKAIAEDAVHDVFMNLVRRAKELVIKTSLKNYLIVSVVNKVRSIQGARNNGGVNLDDVEPAESNAKRPEQWIIHNEQAQKLNCALGQLEYEQREAVVMRVQGELSFRKIADCQQSSLRTVQSRYRYGMNKLRSILNGEVKK